MRVRKGMNLQALTKWANDTKIGGMSDLSEIVSVFEALDEEHTTPKMIYFNFKLTPADKAQLKKDAYRHEMNVSEYLRWLINKQREEDSRGE